MGSHAGGRLRVDYTENTLLLIDAALEQKLLTLALSFQVWGTTSSSASASGSVSRGARGALEYSRPLSALSRHEADSVLVWSKKECEVWWEKEGKLWAEKEGELLLREEAVVAREQTLALQEQDELLRPMTAAPGWSANRQHTADIFTMDEEEGADDWNGLDREPQHAVRGLGHIPDDGHASMRSDRRRRAACGAAAAALPACREPPRSLWRQGRQAPSVRCVA